MGKWPLRLGDAYNYASNFGEVAFLVAFGSLCASCAELLVYLLLGCCHPFRGSVREACYFNEAEYVVGEKEGRR